MKKHISLRLTLLLPIFLQVICSMFGLTTTSTNRYTSTGGGIGTCNEVPMPTNCPVATKDGPHGPGSNPACVTSVAVSNPGNCEDLGTSCITDDPFTCVVTVTFPEVPATGTLEISSSFFTTISVPVGSLSGTSHVITDIQCAGVNITIDVEAHFSENPTCNATDESVTRPVFCSDVILYPDITVSGLTGACAQYNGVYPYARFYGGGLIDYANFATSNFIRFEGDHWAMFYGFDPNNTIQTNPSTDGSYAPCTGWVDVSGLGCGTATLSGGCGPNGPIDRTEITDISIANISTCNNNGTGKGNDDTFTADVTLNYQYAPSTSIYDYVYVYLNGTLVASEQNFNHLDCATTWTFTGVTLPTDGAPMIFSADFNGTHSFTSASLGTAPTACAYPEMESVGVSNFSVCAENDPDCVNDNTFTADVTVHYSMLPPSGSIEISSLDIVGAAPSVAVGSAGSATEHTFTGVTFKADGQGIQIAAAFTGETPLENYDAGTGPTCNPSATEPSISDISIANLTGCQNNGTGPGYDDFFTADLTVTFANAPANAHLYLYRNGSYVGEVATNDLGCATTYTFTGAYMYADGGDLIFSTDFDGNYGFTAASFGTAPGSCAYAAIDYINVLPTSSCESQNTTCYDDDTYTADVTVYFNMLPATGFIELSGPDLVGTPPPVAVADVPNPDDGYYTITGVTFRADGESIQISAGFTGGTPFEITYAGTAPNCAPPPISLVVVVFQNGYGDCTGPGITGAYMPSSAQNGVPSWTRNVSGNITTVTWSGTRWELYSAEYYNTTGGIGLIAHADGTAAALPCNGWVMDNQTCSVSPPNLYAGCGTLPTPPAPSISSISMANASACNNNNTGTATDDYFTANVTVNFAYAPGTGNLTLKRGATVLATKSAAELACVTSWTFTGVHLATDGASIVLTAEFNGTTFTSASLGTAPANCAYCEITAISTANASACAGNNTTCATDDSYTADVTVTYSTPPASGTLALSGADIVGTAPSVAVGSIGATSYTFIGVTLKADGAAIELTAAFSADGACTFTNANAGTAPAACTTVAATLGNIFYTEQCQYGANLIFAPNGTYNGLPKWTATSNAAINLRWSGTQWQIHRGYVMAYHNSSDNNQVPCSGWVIDCTGPSTFTLSGSCGVPFVTTAPCSISNITAGTFSACNNNGTASGADDYFTSNVTVNFAYAPSSGNLTLKRSTTVLATKSAADLACVTTWVFENVQMAANGANTVLTAEFSAGCAFTSASLGTAPASCSCSPVAETCNGLDDDCDGLIDEGVTTNYYADADNDTYGNANGTPSAACSAPPGYVTDHTDCNDAQATTYPTALERCANGFDDDCDGSVDESPFLIDQPNYIKNVSCFGGNNGVCRVNATVFATAVIGDYTFLWNNGDTNRSAIVPAGTYSVTVTHVASTCSQAQLGFVVADPSPITVNELMASHKNAGPCNGATNGEAEVSATGGTGTLKYKWSNAAGSITKKIINLAAGTYTCTVTDVRGCTGTKSVTILQPPLLDITTVASAAMPAPNVGKYKATITAVGGTGTKWYSKNNLNWQASNVFSQLLPGTYTFWVKDAGNCKDSYLVNVPACGTGFTLDASSIIHPACFGNSTGNAKVNSSIFATNPDNAFTFAWSNGATTRNNPNLPAGTYSVTVTQIATGCSATRLDNVLVDPPLLTVAENAIGHKNVPCKGASTGEALVQATGGTAGKAYLWSNGVAVNSIVGVTVGTYSVTATDVRNCTATTSVTITEPATNVDVTNVVIAPMPVPHVGKYTATITAAGGTGTLKYSKNGTAYIPNNIFYQLLPGAYTFYARDANLCVDAYTVTISALGAEDRVSSQMSDAGFLSPRLGSGSEGMQLLLSPNPASGALNVALLEIGNGEQGLLGEMLIQDALGRIVLRQKVEMKQGESLQLNLDGWHSGHYCLQVRGEKGEMAVKCFVVE